MYWKDSLAKEILAKSRVTYAWLVSRQSDYPSLRVKTIDARGEVPVIQLSGTGQWLKPKEWANNHVANLTQRYQESQARLVELGSDPSKVCAKSCPAVCELKANSDSDPGEVDELYAEIERARHNYECAMDAVVSLKRGREPSVDVLYAIAGWTRGDGRDKYWFK